MEDETKTKIKVTYNGVSISYFNLPSNLSKFKSEFISQFGLSNQLTPDDITTIKYNEELIKDDSTYKIILKKISQEKNPDINANIINIETEKVPIHFEGDKSIEFEEEIKILVENELKVAAEHIKKGLTSNLSLSNCKKIRKEICQKCQKQIIGYLFKKISGDDDNEYFCELCAIDEQEPMFKIH